MNGSHDLPEVGSLWECEDEVYRVMKVYEASERDGSGHMKPVTLVKFVMVDPMPHHCYLSVSCNNYTPYEPDDA